MNFSQVKAELRQRMQTAIQQNENTIKGKITFDQEFCGFDGHFPDNPIVPATCLLATAELMAMELTNCQLQLQEISSMKFKKHLVPQDTANLKGVMQKKNDNCFQFTVTITTEKNDLVANIKLIMTRSQSTAVSNDA